MIDDGQSNPTSADPEEETRFFCVNPILLDSSPVGDGTPAKLRQLQLDDPNLKFVLDAKESNQRPSEEAVKAKGPDVRNLVQIWDQLVMSSGVLKRRFEDKEDKTAMLQWVVPKQQRKEILHHLQGGPMGAHLGESKTLKK